MTTPEANKGLVRELVELVNGRNLGGVERVTGGQIAQAARGWIGPFATSFPDFRMEIEDLIGEDDKVVAHFKCSGTHTGEWRGRAPTGRRFEGIDEVYIFRAEGGKLVSATVVEDNLGRLRQLGFEP